MDTTISVSYTHLLAALITYLTRRPVKVRLTRAESLLIHPKRHHFEMDFTMGCDCLL